MTKRPMFGLLLWAALAAMMCHSGHAFDTAENSTAALQAGDQPAVLPIAGFEALNLMEDQTLHIQGVQQGQLQAVALQTMTLRVASPDIGQDLTFLQSVDLYVNDAATGKPQLLAHGDTFAAGQSLVGLDVTDVDLTPGIKANPALNLSLQATYNSAPTQNIVLEARTIFRVTTTPSQALCSH